MKKVIRERRRNFYIKKEFQRNFILKFCALVAAGAVMSGAIIYAMTTSTVTTTFENLRLTIRNTADYILPTVIFSSAIVFVLMGMVTIIITLLMSHRIGGALYAIEKQIERVASGDLQTKFHLRTDDEIKLLTVGLNVMVHNLREDVENVKDAVSELESAISAAPTVSSPSAVNDKLAKVKESVNKFIT